MPVTTPPHDASARLPRPGCALDARPSDIEETHVSQSQSHCPDCATATPVAAGGPCPGHAPAAPAIDPNELLRELGALGADGDAGGQQPDASADAPAATAAPGAPRGPGASQGPEKRLDGDLSSLLAER